MSAPAVHQTRAQRRARHYRKLRPDRNAPQDPPRKDTRPAAQPGPAPALRGHAGKKPYPTRREAEAVIAGRDQRTALRFHPLNAYQCRLCGWWHIGHNRREVPAFPGPAASLPAPAG